MPTLASLDRSLAAQAEIKKKEFIRDTLKADLR